MSSRPVRRGINPTVVIVVIIIVLIVVGVIYWKSLKRGPAKAAREMPATPQERKGRFLEWMRKAKPPPGRTMPTPPVAPKGP